MMRIVEIRDRFDPTPYRTVVTNSDAEVERLETLAADKGLVAAIRFPDPQLTTVGWLEQLDDATVAAPEVAMRAAYDTARQAALARGEGLTRCDACGDVSNSAPGLRCGRVDDDGPACSGTYRELGR